LNVPNEGVIADVQDGAFAPARRMIHHPYILAIEVPDMAEIVSCGMTRGEDRLEVRPAAIERVTANIDDPRIGKDEPDECDVHPVHVKLVDEEWLLGRPV